MAASEREREREKHFIIHFSASNSLLRSQLDIQTLGSMVQAFDNFLINVSPPPLTPNQHSISLYDCLCSTSDSGGYIGKSVDQVQLSLELVSVVWASSWLRASPPADALCLRSVYALSRHLQPTPAIAMTYELYTLNSDTSYIQIHLWFSSFPFPIRSFQYSSHLLCS